MVCICRLHSLDCGIVSAWCGTVIWRLLSTDVFGTGVNDSGVSSGLGELSQQLVRWWPRGLRHSRKKTWLKQVRKRNIGPRSKPFLKFRAGSASKARLCLRFLVQLLQRHRHTLDAAGFHGTRLLKSGLAFRRVYAALAAAEKVAPTDAACNALLEDMITGLRMAKKSRIHTYPKCHMCVHLAKQAGQPSIIL